MAWAVRTVLPRTAWYTIQDIVVVRVGRVQTGEVCGQDLGRPRSRTRDERKETIMNVEIWSDVVCPWCYIGKRRFEAALAQFAHAAAVQVTWRSFELDPSAPARYPGTLTDLLATKMRTTPAQAHAANKRLTDLAAEDGLDFHLDQAQPGNTFDAHRLIHLAAAHGRQDAVKEALLHAYFSEGAVPSDPETLVAIVSATGIPADDIRAVLASDAYAADVRADEQRGAAFGITGVPFVVIDERYGVSGAQPVEVFLQTLETAWAASQPLMMVGSVAGAETCTDDSCVV